MQLSSQSPLPVPAAGLLTAIAAIAGVWTWLGAPAGMPPSPFEGREKLYCVSYAPFRGEQNPLDPATRIESRQIEEDLARLAPLTDCVRTYATEHGVDQVPAIAQRFGMKVMLGLWLGREAEKNRREIESAVALAKRYPDTVRAIVVGNEVLLRGEMAASDLAAAIRNVKTQVGVPVTYADVWEFWLRNRDVYEAVDFVTIHILPYWEDFPIPAEQAAAHVVSIRRQVATAFPNKDILIGETGWPSEGRMREGARPSPANQARVLHDILAAAKRENFRVNVIEAFDQPWKRHLEGTVGGHWGLLDAWTRKPKFEWGAPVSNHPLWRWQAAGGALFAVLVFGAAFAARARRPGATVLDWIGVTINAVAGATMAGLTAERIPLESLGAGGWLRSFTFLAIAVAAPVLGSIALMRASPVPAFARIVARAGERVSDRLSWGLGLVLIVLTLLSLQTALGLAFDPRYRDFPDAPLTAGLVPFLILALITRPAPGQRGAAEISAAGSLILSALYIVFNESFANWQSLWFCAGIGALALILLAVRDARS